MAAQQNVDIDAMDWGPGGIELGTQEAEEVATALVSAEEFYFADCGRQSVVTITMKKAVLLMVQWILLKVLR